MSDQAQTAEPRTHCGHVCLNDENHVQRGQGHFYGYEIPDPWERAERAEAEAERLRMEIEADKTNQRIQLGELADEFGIWGCDITDHLVDEILGLRAERDGLRTDYEQMRQALRYAEEQLVAEHPEFDKWDTSIANKALRAEVERLRSHFAEAIKVMDEHEHTETTFGCPICAYLARHTGDREVTT